MAMVFTEASIPDLSGQVVVVTGANSGIGFEAARAMTARGATVVMACRNVAKGERALERIRALTGSTSAQVEELDLSRLASVRAFAERIGQAHGRVDRLVNNAGVMAIPYERTEDGFEMQMGTNHFGHFALTGLLLDALIAAPAPRVVTVSSLAHWFGSIRFGDLHWERRYAKWPAYAQSKLANLLFAFELQRRFTATRTKARSIACHPGFASTNLQFVGPRLEGSRLTMKLMELNNRFIAQSAADGALPTLYAAYNPDLRGGEFIGPAGPLGVRGRPGPARTSRKARDPALAERLWDVSEALTGVTYRF